MSKELITAEVNKKLDALEISGGAWLERDITLAICSDHAEALDADNEHSWFHAYCGYDTCRDIVRNCIKKRAGDSREADAMAARLPGFEFMTPRYTVERIDDETGEIQIIGLRVEDMTDDELEQKAIMYDAMAESLRRHAAEIRRYLKGRQAARARFRQDQPEERPTP